MKVGLKTSNLPDETIDDIRTEEELKENIDSIEHGNPTNGEWSCWRCRKILWKQGQCSRKRRRSCGAVAGWYKTSSSGSNGCEFKNHARASVLRWSLNANFHRLSQSRCYFGSVEVQGISHRRDWCVREDEEPAFKDGYALMTNLETQVFKKGSPRKVPSWKSRRYGESSSTWRWPWKVWFEKHLKICTRSVQKLVY